MSFQRLCAHIMFNMFAARLGSMCDYIDYIWDEDSMSFEYYACKLKRLDHGDLLNTEHVYISSIVDHIPLGALEELLKRGWIKKVSYDKLPSAKLYCFVDTADGRFL